MRNILYKSSAVIINLIEGAVAVIAFAVSYAFMFETDNQDHSIGLGLFVLLTWLFVLMIPNLFFRFSGKFRIRELLFFQFIPFVLGAVVYLIFQFVLY